MVDVDVIRVKEVLDQLATTAVEMNDIVVSLPHAEEPYYKFLYLLAKYFKFSDIVELGVYKGTGLAHLYEGSGGYYVTGVDNDFSQIDPMVMIMTNVELAESDSVAFFGDIAADSVDFGLFHVDTIHNGEQAKRELAEIFRVSRKAIICVDDIYINEAMIDFWQSDMGDDVVKFEYPELHVTGYGVIYYCKGEEK